MYRSFLKRILDFVSAVAGIIIFSPVILITWLFLMIQNKGTPFFFQKRPGLHQRPFNIIKFKSMTDAKDENENLLPDNQRITRFGAIVRKLSIDELPQLINVLKGDMSLVGPRPLLFKYISLYTPEQLRRHEVRPGITGWAQVNGRNSISWKQKFAFDIEYVDKVSFLMDIKIIIMTIKKVLIREGLNQSDDRPMQPFNGSN